VLPGSLVTPLAIAVPGEIRARGTALGEVRVGLT
jgi:hypothetical protein